MSTAKRMVEKYNVKSLLLLAPTSRTISRSLYPTLLSMYSPHDKNRPELKVNHIYFPGYDAEMICVSAESGPDAIRSYNVSVNCSAFVE